MTKSLANRMIVLVMASMVGLSVIVVLIAGLASYNNNAQMAADRLETAMRVATRIVGEGGAAFDLNDGELRAGPTVLNGNNAMVDAISKITGGSATIFARDTRIATNLTNPDGSRAIGTKLTNPAVLRAVLEQGKTYRGMVDAAGHKVYAAYDPIRSRDGQVIGVLYTGIAADAYLASLYQVIAVTALAALVVSALGVWLAVRQTKVILNPLRDLGSAIEAMASDPSSVPVPHATRDDEVGQIARGLVMFQDSHRARRDADAAHASAIAILADRLQGLAQGDLTVRVGTALTGAYAQIARDFDASAQALSEALNDIVGSSERIHSTANELRSASHDLARRTEQQASGLNQTTRSMHEHAGNARRSATIAGDARQAMNALLDRLTQSDAVIVQTAQAMDAIARSSSEISQIATLIDGIAFQTNLLALNAGVEAARAGDAGRGFAVVASEVRALAQRSADAARDVKERIARAGSEVGDGVRMVDLIATTLRDAGTQIGQIGEIIEQIATHSGEQAAGFAQISTTIGQIDGMTQQNSAMVEQATAATNGLSDEASGLRIAVGRFRIVGRETVVPLARRRA